MIVGEQSCWFLPVGMLVGAAGGVGDLGRALENAGLT